VTALRVHGLFKVFGRHPQEAVRRLLEGATATEVRAAGATPAVIDAGFAVEPGEVFVVMGLSGSGKSTLLRMLNGLLEPTAGTVHLGEEQLTGLPAKRLRALRRQRISMVFQHFALLPHRSVLDNAAYALEVRGVDRRTRHGAAREALAMVGLERDADRRPAELSGGMQQRVGLARALASEADVLLMDEAFSALDPLIRREMQDQLVDLQSRLGKTIVFITHDLNEAMRIGHRVAIMREGRIVRLGTPGEILARPGDDHVARFLADVDRGRVFTAADVMTPATGHSPAGAERVAPGTLLADLLAPAARSEAPLEVGEPGGPTLGVVSRAAVLAALDGRLPSPDRAPARSLPTSLERLGA
jgi:glycine betaine/proline transport system ATP-binding protein